MRSEFEHVKERPDALAWLIGCVLASYRSRLADLWKRDTHQILRRLGAFAIVVIAVGYALESRACGQTPPPTFTDTACDLPHLTPDIEPRLRCGVVAVPRNYDHPEGGQFKLAVVVIRSERQPGALEPVVYMSGGPGGPLTVFTADQATHPIAPGRDVILMDQRGTGRSEPGLCPSLASGLAEAVVEAHLDLGAEQRRRAFYADCRKQAEAQGIDLTDFGTQVTVRDFDRVRQALGIKQWNLFGVSYGTTVAMTLMALHPDTVRSAVLDSINPPDPILPPWSTNVTNATGAFLAYCQAEPSCNTAYPDLVGTYRDTVDQLRKAPLSFPVPAGPSGFQGHGLLTAGLFKFVVGRLVYYPRFYPGLPRLIAHVQRGDTTDVAVATAALAADGQDLEMGQNFSANAAIDCRDRPRFHDPLAPPDDELDRASLHTVCNDWVSLGPPPLVPIGTTIPTLMLAGEFDPNARPTFSRSVATLIGSHVSWIEIAGAGHSARSTNACAAGIVSAFIERPTQPVAASCAARRPPIRFLSP